MSFSTLISTLRSVKDNEGDLEKVPAMFWERNTWGPDFFLELTKFHWSAVRSIHPDEITDEIASAAISQCPIALGLIPVQLRTLELCREATDRDIGALESVPYDFAEGLFERWLESEADYPSESSVWRRIPRRFQTEQWTLKAIFHNPRIIQEIPIEQHTQAMCDAYVRGCFRGDYDPCILSKVNTESRSRILCISCLKADPGSKDAVPRLLWGPGMIEAENIGLAQEAARQQ